MQFYKNNILFKIFLIKIKKLITQHNKCKKSYKHLTLQSREQNVVIFIKHVHQIYLETIPSVTLFSVAVNSCVLRPTFRSKDCSRISPNFRFGNSCG